MTYGTIPIAGGDTATPRNLAARLAVIARHVTLDGATMLDAGCGAGEYVEALARLGADVRGVEYLAHKVEAWAARHPTDGRVSEGDISRLPFAGAAFDIVLLNEVLEHVPNESAVLTEVRRVLRPGGTLILFAPNRRYPFETHGLDRNGRIPPLKTFGLPWLPVSLLERMGFHAWARNYWPGRLRDLLTEHGFDIVAHDYLWQTFENISGQQPRVIRLLAPLLRLTALIAQRVPLVRSVGASQVLVAVTR